MILATILVVLCAKTPGSGCRTRLAALLKADEIGISLRVQNLRCGTIPTVCSTSFHSLLNEV